MTDYEWTQAAHGFTLTKDEIERATMVRIKDPWWRRPLVRLGILAPRYRKMRIADLIYGDGGDLPPEFRGLDRK